LWLPTPTERCKLFFPCARGMAMWLLDNVQAGAPGLGLEVVAVTAATPEVASANRMCDVTTRLKLSPPA
jgi:hypothetical protein